MQTTRRSTSRRKFNLPGNGLPKSDRECSRRQENEFENVRAAPNGISSSGKDEETFYRGTRNVPAGESEGHRSPPEASPRQTNPTPNPDGSPRGYLELTNSFMTFCTDYTAMVTADGRDTMSGVHGGATNCLQESASPCDGRFSASTLRTGDATSPPLLTDIPLPAQPIAAVMSGVSSLRSNLKHKGQVRRRRSDSGHSVTFDLPEDCDNFGGLRENVRDEAEPLSKCMKEQSNRSRQFDGKPETEGNHQDLQDEEAFIDYLHTEHDYCRPSDRCTLQALSERVQKLQEGVTLATNHIASDADDMTWTQDEGHVHHSFTWHQAQLQVTSEAFNTSITNGVLDFVQRECSHLVLEGGEDMTPSDVKPPASEEVSPYLTLPPLHPRQPSPLPPHLLASLAWSCGESGSSGSSSTKGPDSGYWGTGESCCSVASGGKGVKVVTHGREFLLPYAFLHQGRLKLRIVRGKSPAWM